MSDDEHPTEVPHPTDAEMRKCSVCGYTRRDAPSVLKSCCGQPMEIVYESSIQKLNEKNLPAYDLTKLSILVLEKHLLIRKLLTDVFSEFGVPTVHSTPDPEMAWDLFILVRVDLILCDWAHGLDGMAFLKRIRRDGDSTDPYVPVIICTANTEAQHVRTARDTGMTQFLTKPVSAKTIYSRICAVIEKPRPYIRVGDFFGPDRRRHLDKEYAEVDRRKLLH